MICFFLAIFSEVYRLICCIPRITLFVWSRVQVVYFSKWILGEV